MRICGIIAEFNPFHNGHAHLMEQARCQGATHLVVAMSGNFVQRGEPAAFSKWRRTEMALKAGADLVLELPVPWAMAGAETFARGSVGLLAALGCVDRLVFGCECGDITALQNAVRALDQTLVLEQTRKYLEQGVSFPAARQNAVRQVFGEETAAVLQNPNNILAVEYCRAIKKQGCKIIPFAIPRVGAFHDAAECNGEFFASASFLRKHLDKPDQIAPYLPNDSAKIISRAVQKEEAPCTYTKMERAVLSQLRRMDSPDFIRLPDVTEGLEHRLYRAAQDSRSLEEFWMRAKTKRYTQARLRRITLSAFLGIQKTDAWGNPPYLRILGLRETGREILRAARQTASIPIHMRAKEFVRPREARLFALENHATDLWALGTPAVLPCHMEKTEQIILLP